LSFGRIIWWIVIALVVTALVWTGVWQYLPLSLSEFPMLTWLPLLALVAVGFAAGAVRRLVSDPAAAPAADRDHRRPGVPRFRRDPPGSRSGYRRARVER
jgi:hypothetical protein